MKVMTILGTRPEIIRLSRIIPLLDEHADHTLVHTGQNYTDTLSAVFFRGLGVRDPDVFLGVQAPSFGEQIGQILTHTEALLRKHRPDRVLILGDTNSGLAAIVARRLGIPVYHLEAGNRCYDDRVPEEVNRRVIDHSSSVLLPYTNRSRENLLREGITGERIHVVGNPIKQVIDHHAPQISASTALGDLEVSPGKYFLVTLHRAENVDGEASAPPRRRPRRALRALRASRHHLAASPHQGPHRGVWGQGGSQGSALAGTPRVLRFRPAGAAGVLRAHRQRHGSGRDVSLRSAQCDDPRRHRTARDHRRWLQRACRFRSRRHRRRGPPGDVGHAHMDTTSRIPRRTCCRDRGADRPRLPRARPRRDRLGHGGG